MELRPCPYCHHPAQPMERGGMFGKVYGVRCSMGSSQGCVRAIMSDLAVSSRNPQRAYRKWNRKCEKIERTLWNDAEMRT